MIVMILSAAECDHWHQRLALVDLLKGGASVVEITGKK